MIKPIYGLALLAVTVIALYVPILDHPFYFDSLSNLNHDRLSIVWQVTESPWDFYYSPRWIPHFTFLATYHLFGLQESAYHSFNLLLHLGNTCLIFFFLQSIFHAVLTDNGKERNGWTALLGAFLFGLHPITVYGTAYAVQRTILCATMFSLLALMAFWKGLGKERKRWLFASVALYFCAVHSKEHAVMLPAIMAAMVILLKPTKHLLKLWPVFLALAMVLIHTVHIKTFIIGEAAEGSTDIAIQQKQLDAEGLQKRSILTQGTFFFRYLGLWAVPLPSELSIEPSIPIAAEDDLLAYTAGFVGYLLMAALAAWLLFLRGRWGLLGLGLLFPWFLFLTEFTTIRYSETFVFYRSYLWMAGLGLFLPVLVRPKRDWICTIAGALVVTILGILMHERLDSFGSEYKVWDDAIRKVDPKHCQNYTFARSYANRGKALNDEARAMDAVGRMGEGRQKRQQAIRDYDHAILQNKKYGVAYSNRGLTWLDLYRLAPQGEKEQAHLYMAKTDLEQAVKAGPLSGEMLVSLGNVHRLLNRPAEAFVQYDRCVKAFPGFAEGLANRGEMYRLNGMPGKAEADFREALRVAPPAWDKREEVEKILRTMNASGH